MRSDEQLATIVVDLGYGDAGKGSVTDFFCSLAEDGLVVPVVAINKQTGMLEGVPDIITRGFVMENSQALLADASRLLAEVVEQASLEERTEQGLIKEKLRVELRRFFRKRSGRRPFVLPVIMEI